MESLEEKRLMLENLTELNEKDENSLEKIKTLLLNLDILSFIKKRSKEHCSFCLISPGDCSKCPLLKVESFNCFCYAFLDGGLKKPAEYFEEKVKTTIRIIDDNFSKQSLLF